ncbi:MAG: M20/M25/M40 family metallo-hydrolase [Desulfosarcina sp.]
MSAGNFNLREEIGKIVSEYVGIESTTNTVHEKKVEPFLGGWFADQEYFRDNPDLWGMHPVDNDPLERRVVWGMVKGNRAETIVLLHHYDVIDAEEFEAAKPFAHDLKHIRFHLRKMIHKFDADARKDLKDERWQFGRGVADMKAGGAIQMALLKKYSLCKNVQGNIVLCCLPDEENLSAGMRSAVKLLSALKETHGLNYRLMIDSEPHERVAADTGVIYEGSVGKITPVFYVRGSVAHVGSAFDGLNPLHLLSDLMIHTELNMDLSEHVSDGVIPPPSWLYLRDKKEGYDVSIPTVACAAMNALTLNVRPEAFLKKLKTIAVQSFENVLERIDTSYRRYVKESGRSSGKLPWRVQVKTFSEVYDEIINTHGIEFETSYRREQLSLGEKINRGSVNLIEGSFSMMAFCLRYFPDKTPIVVIGLSPPYYPDVCNDRVRDISPAVKNIARLVNEFSMKSWNQPYVAKKYFTGISDLSYSYTPEGDINVSHVADNMPLWGTNYQIPFEEIKKIKMPCVNVGPWGKDLHKLTERVCTHDLYEKTPAIVDFLIQQVLIADSESVG